jgi:hypothetical protein
MAAPAFAGPGNSQKQQAEDDGSTASSESSEDSSPGNSGNAPGKNKKDDKDEESSSSSGSGSQSSDSKGSGPSDNSANSPAPEDSQQGKPAQGCDQANAGYDHNYASTCDGSPSQNGNGGGGANGKPCAGCVGAADNKNPKGQFPDGSDHNNGYECDGNNGIGKGNPAHTSCQVQPLIPPPPPPPPPCDGDLNMPGNQPCVEPPAPCDKNLNKPGIQPCVPDVIEDGAIPDIVLGGGLVRDDEVLGIPPVVQGAVLPLTGPASIATFLFAALGLMSAGLLALRGKRSS